MEVSLNPFLGFFVDKCEQSLTNFASSEYLNKILKCNLKIWELLFDLAFAFGFAFRFRFQGLQKLDSEVRVGCQT